MFLALALGFLLPATGTWFLLRAAEGRAPVLTRTERALLSLLLGPTLAMFLAFLVHVTTGLALNRTGFLAVILGYDALAAALWAWRRRGFQAGSPAVAAGRYPRGIAGALLGLLSVWSLAKVAIAGTVFLLFVPTFLDDALDNWNLRAKVYYQTEQLLLVLPGQDAASAPSGVSSYPPAVPLFKAWLAFLRGGWNEGLVNAPHVLWFLLLCGLLYCALRRLAAPGWAVLGVCILCALPLEIMHATNSYADVYLSAHLFAAVTFLLLGVRAAGSERAGLLRVAGIAAAALAFTKNESVLLYLPGLAAVWGACLWRAERAERGPMLRATIAAAGIALCVLLPWLAFKWANGLTFGNAKPISGFAFGWQENVPFAVTVNLLFEGNWLLLPVLLPALLLWRRREAFGTPLAVAAGFTLLLFLGQIPLYLFTSLSAEVLRQTGYGRGLVHLAPLAVLTVAALLPGAWRELHGD